MADETKMPCEPMGEAGRDYNELGIFRYKENNPTLEASGHDGTHLCKALGVTPNELFGIEPQYSTSNCRFQTFNP